MSYEIIDDSHDRKYFTIVPNYVLNHSSAIDKGLYLDMKRKAGENGLCFMTEETMCRRNGIGDKQLHKSLKYLVENKWIEFVGTTPGKTRPIKTYRIVDIWRKNVEFYYDKKKPSESRVSKDNPSKNKDTRPKQDKIPVESRGIRRTNIKEEPIKKNINKKYSSLSDIKDIDIKEIAERYKTSVGFVLLQKEKLKNYCEAKGRRYKNYKFALRNFVLGDMQRNAQNKKDDKYRGVDATNI